LDTGCGHAVVWVGAVGTVLKRRGALGVNANQVFSSAWVGGSAPLVELA